MERAKSKVVNNDAEENTVDEIKIGDWRNASTQSISLYHTMAKEHRPEKGLMLSVIMTLHRFFAVAERWWLTGIFFRTNKNPVGAVILTSANPGSCTATSKGGPETGGR